ncbi:MAG: hypothetical protein JST32_05080 [Bacteroidetes bacterium]|nr:hypothetical protein [Bacteroidota bacterium]
MKTKTFIKIGILLSFMISSRTVFAQIDLPNVIIRATSAVNVKVADAFKGKFQNAVNPRWYKMDKNYLIKFMMVDQKNSALYDKEGNLIYHVSYGEAKHLPQNYLDMVNTEYPGCKVVTAIHIEQNKRSLWLVNIEYKKDYVLTKIEDDELQEVSRVANATAK